MNERMMMTEKITSNQENRIVDLVRDAVRVMSLSKAEAQQIIMAGGILQDRIKPIFQKLAMVDHRFGPAMKDFLFTVPSDYKHDTQLDDFSIRTKLLKTTYYFNDNLNSKNFAEATKRLTPGKIYRVQVIPILSKVSSEDCITFLKKKGVILVGAQGLTLLQSKLPKEFPVGKLTVSFDEKDALPFLDGFHGVPYVHASSGGGFGFSLGDFGNPWFEDVCLLCFCEV